MGRPKNGTICSKHEKIASLAEQIQDLVGQCLEDGGNMEDGLATKRARIKDLESEVESLKDDLARAERRIEDLEDQLKDAQSERVSA